MKAAALLLISGLLLAHSLPAAPAPRPAKQSIDIPMRNGATLAADLFLPAGFPSEKDSPGLPTILIITPYDKSRENAVGFWRDTMLRNGYAFIVEDMRGNYGSANAGRGAPRHNDGYDTIEWIAKQPWSNGKVGMMGFSHLGAVQYETAVSAPPHLACAIPALAPGNYYTDSYFPQKFRKADMETLLRGELTAHTQQLLNRRIHGAQHVDIRQFNIPMLHSAGWFDFYKEGGIEMFNALQKDGGPGARGQQKLLIGPWGHGVLQEEDPGTPLRLDSGFTFPANAKLEWEKDIWLPWFDHWLKGKETGVMKQPAVLYYLMGAMGEPNSPGNCWVAAQEFPPKGVAVTYYAHADHSLRTTLPQEEHASIPCVYDPRDPVPTVGRLHARTPVKGPYDQREVEKRPDVLLFTTALMTAPLEIVGQIRAKVWAASSCVDTDFTAKLTDVYPDGRSINFLDGIVKGRYRNTYLKQELLTPGQIYEFEIDLGYIALALAPGHRLRFAISSSNFDRFDINPNTGEPYGDHAVTRELMAKRIGGYESHGPVRHTAFLTATNTVYLDRAHPTQLILPSPSSLSSAISPP